MVWYGWHDFWVLVAGYALGYLYGFQDRSRIAKEDRSLEEFKAYFRSRE